MWLIRTFDFHSQWIPMTGESLHPWNECSYIQVTHKGGAKNALRSLVNNTSKEESSISCSGLWGWKSWSARNWGCCWELLPRLGREDSAPHRRVENNYKDYFINFQGDLEKIWQYIICPKLQQYWFLFWVTCYPRPPFAVLTHPDFPSSTSVTKARAVTPLGVWGLTCDIQC